MVADRNPITAPLDLAPESSRSSTVAWFGRLSDVFFWGSLLSAALFMIKAAQDPATHWPKYIDDMYYYFLLVRNSAHGGLVSVDGLHATNGFHPLYFLLLRAIYPFTSEASLPAVAVTILSLFHAATAITLWVTLRRLAGRFLAGLLAGIYVANPFLLGVLFYGMETPIACFFGALGIWGYLRWSQTGGRGFRAVMLVAMSLAVFARSDTFILTLAIAVAQLGPWRGVAGRNWRKVDYALIAACAVPIAAFGIWSQLYTGAFLQTSGSAHAYWGAVGYWRDAVASYEHLGVFAVPIAALSFLAAVVAAFPVWGLASFYQLLAFHPLGWALVGARIVQPPLKGGEKIDVSTHSLARSLAYFLVLLWGFYSIAFRHAMEWYWHTSIYAGAILVGIWLERLRRADLTSFLSFRRWRTAAVVTGLLMVAFSNFGFNALASRPEEGHEYSGRSSAIPLGGIVESHDRAILVDAGRTHARPLLEIVPKGSLVGVFDSGAIGWDYPELRVVNLDGLVNNSAFEAIRGGRIGQYMLDERIDFFLSDPSVIRRFSKFGLRSFLDHATLVCRWDNGVVLYRADH